jgi:hypothetical protein
MRYFVSVLALYAAAMSPAMATGFNVPEPESIALFAIGAVALVANQVKRKK